MDDDRDGRNNRGCGGGDANRPAYVGAVARQSVVNAFLDKFDLREDKARLLLDLYDFAGFISASLLPPSLSSDGGVGYRDGPGGR